jgi:hypothetical protein
LDPPGETVSYWGQTVDFCMNSSERERACVAMHFRGIYAYFIAFPCLGLAPSLGPRLPTSIVIPCCSLFGSLCESSTFYSPCFYPFFVPSVIRSHGSVLMQRFWQGRYTRLAHSLCLPRPPRCKSSAPSAPSSLQRSCTAVSPDPPPPAASQPGGRACRRPGRGVEVAGRMSC